VPSGSVQEKQSLLGRKSRKAVANGALDERDQRLIAVENIVEKVFPFWAPCSRNVFSPGLLRQIILFSCLPKTAIAEMDQPIFNAQKVWVEIEHFRSCCDPSLRARKFDHCFELCRIAGSQRVTHRSLTLVEILNLRFF